MESSNYKYSKETSFTVDDIDKFLKSQLDLGYNPVKILRNMQNTYQFKNPVHKLQFTQHAKRFLENPNKKIPIKEEKPLQSPAMKFSKKTEKKIDKDSVDNVVNNYLNTGEKYFHIKRNLVDQVKQPRDLYGPMSDRPETWDYTDKRDFKKEDFDNILNYASECLDSSLFSKIPEVALKAALDFSIYTYDNGRYQSKIDAPTYLSLFSVLNKLNKEKN